MPPLLSVAIITKDEEHNLQRTLESVSFADEIVVVDARSSDRTVEIARSFNAIVYEEPWQGFAAQKNLAMARCSGEWVLSLDADEELSLELQNEIQTLLASEPPYNAYLLRRRNLFLGRWIKHGGFYPDAKLRLFRQNKADVSTLPRFAERPVHETMAFAGETGTLRFDLLHHAYPTLESYLEHMNRYSSLGAQVLVTRGESSRSWLVFCCNVFVVPQLMFLWNYVFRLGFLDGREGLLLHLYHASYTSWKYAKAWESERKA